MSLPRTRSEYLERLRDLLPWREAGRILREVDGLIADRVEAEASRAEVDEAEAEARAIVALGPPEDLAQELVADKLEVDLDARRTFTRMLAVLFAGHLVLAIVLTAAGGTGPAIPGLLGPLPTEPFGAVLSAVLGLFLVDTGALFLLFALLGRGRRPSQLPRVAVAAPARPRVALQALVLLGLLALVLGPFRDEIFAIHTEAGTEPILASGVVRLVPGLLLALALFAVRQVLILVHRRESVPGVAADAAGTLVLAGTFVVMGLGGEILEVSAEAVGAGPARALEDLGTRVFLLVVIVAAVFLTARLVTRVLRLVQLAASAAGGRDEAAERA